MTEARSTDTWSRLRRALSALAAAHLLSASNFHSPTTKPGSARPEIKYVRFTFFLFLIRARPTEDAPHPNRMRVAGRVECTAPRREATLHAPSFRPPMATQPHDTAGRVGRIQTGRGEAPLGPTSDLP